MYIYIHIYTRIYIYTYADTCKHWYMYIHTLTYMYRHTYSYIYIHMYPCMYVHIYIYICTYTFTYPRFTGTHLVKICIFSLLYLLLYLPPTIHHSLCITLCVSLSMHYTLHSIKKWYGVASTSRLLKIISLFWKRSLLYNRLCCSVHHFIYRLQFITLYASHSSLYQNKMQCPVFHR